MASRALVYALWCFFGLLGAHHFYLRRYRHGFVWLCTFGGFFYGWLRDFFRMSQYIKEAEQELNDDEEEKDRADSDVTNGTRGKKKASASVSQKHKEPKTSWTRSTGQVTFAVVLSVTFRSAIPEELLEENFWLNHAVNLGAAFFCAVGFHTVGNIGRHALSFKWCLLPSVVGHLIFPAESSTALYGIVGANIAANALGKGWSTRRRSQSRVRPLLAVSMAFMLYLSMWASGLWFNTYITTQDGERVKLKDAVNHFFNSPAWKEMLDTLWHLYEYCKTHGFRNLYNEFIAALDPEGESNAYKVLGLSSSASPQEITSACRKLSRKYHPDKAVGDEAKAAASERFIEVQSACQVLDKLRKRRTERSRSSTDEL